MLRLQIKHHAYGSFPDLRGVLVRRTLGSLLSSHRLSGKPGAVQNLVVAAIVYWNTSYIDKAVNHLRRERRLANSNLLRHDSPLGWEHIVLTGDYDWNSGVAERTNPRRLNHHCARVRA